MRITVRICVSDAGLMHERTYEAAVQLVLTTNVEQAEATARSLMDVCADRATRDFDRLNDDQDEAWQD
jgi:hypothetical protein